jgi:uncharacterized repeat protein (TIGR01451 family)
VLRDWLINDLDNSSQTWKVVVFHQPIFSSGNATISNDQMRTIAQFLQDHGVNMVFNGHEHNYQRSLPIRALPNVIDPPVPGVAQVEVDTAFDGADKTVPDGVLYFVEGAGGNRDLDDNLLNPRGNGVSIDQDDAATGTHGATISGVSYDFLQGVASLADTSLTDDAMKAFLPNPGSGTKITARFKSKVFSFAHVTVDDNVLRLRQISEPLGQTSSASAQNPAPFGTDYTGASVNDPLPNTVFDPVSRSVVSHAGSGVPTLLDVLTVTKPDISSTSSVTLTASPSVVPGGPITFTFKFKNESGYALNGAQAIVTLPEDVSFESVSAGTATVHGRDVVVSVGRLGPDQGITLQVEARVSNSVHTGSILRGFGVLRSGTALPVAGGRTRTRIGPEHRDDGLEHRRDSEENADDK